MATSLISALLAVSIDIGDKMSRELKSYGANILIRARRRAALPALFSEQQPAGQRRLFLMNPSCRNIKDIFWRNNIVGFVPMLGGEVNVAGQDIRVLGTLLASRSVSRMKRVRDRQRTVSPFWQVTGAWPQEPVGETPQTLVGRAGAKLWLAARRSPWVLNVADRVLNVR